MRRDEGGMNVMDRDQDTNTDKDPVSAVTRKERELTRLDLERARDGNDLAETFGRQNIGPAIANKQILENKKKEDEKFESAMLLLLQQMREELKRCLEQLNEHIAETNAKIEELRRELETTETLLEKQFGKDWQEKLKKGDLDPNDPLLRQWLMQQEQLKGYLERRKELIQERDELEKRINEIEGADLSDDLKLQKMKEILEQGTSPGVQEVWRDVGVSEQVQETAGAVNTKDGLTLEAENTVFPGVAGVSVAGNNQFGKGLEANREILKSQFAKAADPGRQEEKELVVSHTSPVKGFKPST